MVVDWNPLMSSVIEIIQQFAMEAMAQFDNQSLPNSMHSHVKLPEGGHEKRVICSILIIQYHS